jgi:hypothetical protein
MTASDLPHIRVGRGRTSFWRDRVRDATDERFRVPAVVQLAMDSSIGSASPRIVRPGWRIQLREPQRGIAVGEDDPHRTIVGSDRKVPLRDNRTPNLIDHWSCPRFIRFDVEQRERAAPDRREVDDPHEGPQPRRDRGPQLVDLIAPVAVLQSFNQRLDLLSVADNQSLARSLLFSISCRLAFPRRLGL